MARIFNKIDIVSIRRSETAKQFKRYLITGIISFTVEYGLYVGLVLIGLHYIKAATIVYFIVFWFSFLINRFWSFQSKSDIKKQALQYFLLFIFNLFVANIYLLFLFTDIFGISEFISPILKTGFIVSWNFLIYKYIIYR